MGNLSELVRTILDRGFFFALYGGVFCAGLFMAQHFGFEIPPEVMRWVVVAFIACVSFVIVQGPVSAYSALRRRRRRIEDAQARAENAKRNLSSLFGEEQKILYSLLGDDAPRRFLLSPLMAAESLRTKGVLVVVGEGDGASWMVELDPWIYERRHELRAALEAKGVSAQK